MEQREWPELLVVKALDVVLELHLDEVARLAELTGLRNRERQVPVQLGSIFLNALFVDQAVGFLGLNARRSVGAKPEGDLAVGVEVGSEGLGPRHQREYRKASYTS